MQTRSLSFIMIAFTAITLFSSCSKKSNILGRNIPKNAALVMHMDGAALSAKLPWAEIKQNQLFQQVYADTAVAAYIKAALDNPDNTGIDIKKDIIFFAVKDTSGGYVSLEGTIKDTAKFRQFSSNAAKTTVETVKDGLHFITTDKMSAAWNKDRFALVFDSPDMNEMKRLRNMPDSIAPVAPVIVKRDLAADAAGIFSLKEDNSLADNERFSELLNTKGDVHFWMNGESFNTSSMNLPALSMVNMSKFYEGTAVAATVNFENGKINADIKSYAGKEMTDIWKKYSGNKVNSDMVKRVPDKDIAFLMAMNFKPEGIREFLKLTNMDGFANMGASYLGFTLDDFINANKGDIVLAVSNLKKDSAGKPEMNVLFSASVADKAAFGKLVDAGKKLGSEKMGPVAAGKVFYNSNNNYFAIGNNKDVIDKYVSTASNNNFSFFDKVYGSPLGAYVNFQYIMNAFKPDITKDTLGYAAYDAAIKTWDNLLTTGGEFSKGAISQHVEINLMDKNTNSLKQLNNYLGTMGSIEKKRKSIIYKWDDKAMKMDSLK